MTVIAYRDGVMASDSLIVHGTRYTGTVKKVTKTKDGWLAGGAGQVSDVNQFLEWAETRDPETPPLEALNALLVSPKGVVYCVENDLAPYEVKAEFFSEGSGDQIAMGAMAMGASAEEAVKIAIKYNIGCGGKIQVVKL